MPDTTRIFLCRHASPENPEGVFYGHLPGFGLSSQGRRQALGLGSFLSAYPIRRIYASPLERATETAELAASRLSPPPPIEVREDLVETAWGRYIQGVPRPQAPFRRPLFFVHMVAPGWLPADEKVAAMAERIGRVCAEAVASCRGEAAALISHSDPIKAFWNGFLDRPDWRFHMLPLPKGGLIELEYSGDTLAAFTPHQPIVDDAVVATEA